MKHQEILITAFEPFGAYQENSSQLAAEALQAEFGDSARIEVLPVDHDRAKEEIERLLEETQPRICLCLGQTPSRSFQIETVARKPEAWAARKVRGKHTHRGRWPLRRTQRAIEELGLPAEISSDAGEYVCESTYWSLLAFRHENRFPERAVFLHVPELSESCSLDDVTGAVRAALNCAAQDIRQRDAAREPRLDAAPPARGESAQA